MVTAVINKLYKYDMILSIIMEKLAVTCKILYDNDILHKQQQCVKLKEELNDYILPKIIYESYEEWDNLKTEAIEICQKGVRSFISDGEYRFMRDFGINPGQYHSLYLILFEAFNKIAKGQANQWVCNYAQIINITIKNTIRTLVDIGQWVHIYDALGREGLNTFILKILMEFFDESSTDTYDSIGIIRYFKCSSCNKIHDYCDYCSKNDYGNNHDNKGKCWDCIRIKPL